MSSTWGLGVPKQFGQSIPVMYMDIDTKIDAILMPCVLRMTTVLSTKKHRFLLNR